VFQAVEKMGEGVKQMNIETKIRKLAARKVRITITKKKRSRGGFYVWYPAEGGKQGCAVARTRREALQRLLAIVRCIELECSITPRLPHVGDKKGNP
jgi:hypothetical protein